MMFYDVPMNRSVSTEDSRGLTSYNWSAFIAWEQSTTSFIIFYQIHHNLTEILLIYSILMLLFASVAKGIVF
jgi:hypothetical protein